MPRDFETLYYEQQANHTEARGMLCQERDHWKERAEKAERAISEASNRWIPVSERLPAQAFEDGMSGFAPISDQVLVLDNDAECDVAAYDYADGNWYSLQRATYLSGITHWQPLPAGPDEDDLPDGIRETIKAGFDCAREIVAAPFVPSGSPRAPLPTDPDTPAARYSDLWDYHLGVSGEGPHAHTWADKPHRLVYDLTRMVAELRDGIEPYAVTIEAALGNSTAALELALLYIPDDAAAPFDEQIRLNRAALAKNPNPAASAVRPMRQEGPGENAGDRPPPVELGPRVEALTAELSPSGNYVQRVPDHCDRIIWKGQYYHLPIDVDRDACEEASTVKRECPTCGGTNPAWHPAVQSGGEVHLCEDGWHKPTAAEIRERDPRYPPKMAFEDWQCRPCRHEWGAMTGRAPVHCPECGATNIERIFHGVCLDTKGKS